MAKLSLAVWAVQEAAQDVLVPSLSSVASSYELPKDMWRAPAPKLVLYGPLLLNVRYAVHHVPESALLPPASRSHFSHLF